MYNYNSTNIIKIDLLFDYLIKLIIYYMLLFNIRLTSRRRRKKRRRIIFIELTTFYTLNLIKKYTFQLNNN